jgi:hypothetical protein
MIMRHHILLAFLALIFSSTAFGGEPLVYKWGEIKSDTTWSGEIHIEGQTVVKKGVTLTILPGTTVKFLWSDTDKNNIGDGELNCEGHMVARGTKEAPILFTSARENPKQKDWTYVMVSMDKDALMEYCIFEYAFSGVQVHYSTALFKNNLFRHNYEGLRFSTTHVVIENNDFIENTYAFRYESRGSKTVIRKNRFINNGSAFFPVQKGTSSVKIYDNNLVSGSSGVKMGYNQLADLDYTLNWWGSADEEEIKAKFYDVNVDPELGAVIYKPYLTEPAKDCGIQ